MRTLEVKPGDTVMLVYANWAPREEVVERVGRKYFYLKSWRGAFSLVTGVDTDDGNSRVWTMEGYKAMRMLEDARKELQSFGVNLYPYQHPRLLEIYNALKPLMEK